MQIIMTTAFYITGAILLLSISTILIFMYGRARRMKDESFQLRRRSFIAFYLLLAIHVGTSYDIVTGTGIEVFATLPICTLYAAFATFMMLSSAYFGRKHHHNFFIWFSLLQYPAVLLVFHLFMRFSDKYTRIYSMADILYCTRGEMRIIFLGRLAWLAVVIVCFVFMFCMLIDAYVYFYKKQKGQANNQQTKVMRRDEILDIAIYALLLGGMLAAFMIPSLLPHIIDNLLMSAMIARTYYVYNNFLNYTENMTHKQEVFMKITRRISKISDLERNNPIYHSNSNLDDVADMLEVDRNDFSDYLYEELHTTFSTWMSEKKITHFTSQLLLTDRKINELALACGYANVTSLNRAFKTFYGVTPSEYRDQNHTNREE